MGRSDEAPLEYRRALAFGTPIRDGVERVRERSKGTTVVLGWDSEAERCIVDGARLDRPVTADTIVQGAKQDSATVVTSDLRRAVWWNARLVAPGRKNSPSGGSRHGSAADFAAETGHPVIVVSEEQGTVSLYVKTARYLLLSKQDLNKQLEWGLQALQALVNTPEPLREKGLRAAPELLGRLAGFVVELGDSGSPVDVLCNTLALRLRIPWQLTAESDTTLPERESQVSTGDRPDWLVDRGAEFKSLRTRLTTGHPGVVFVRGVRGIGKTALVNAALPARDAGSVRLERHDLNVIAGLDVMTLVDLVSGTGLDGPGEHHGSSLVRLEKTLRGLGDSRVVVTIDSAEHLGDEETRHLTDPDLDEALEMIATFPGHRVSVLLVTRHELRSPEDRAWPDTGEQLPLGMLPKPEFERYLSSLDRTGGTDFADLHEDTRASLHTRLQGNPRMAELAYGSVVGNEELDFGKLTSMLLKKHAREVPGVLTQLLVQRMDPLHRRVVEGLAALGTAVPESAVARLLGDESPARIAVALSALADDQVIYRLGSGAGDDQFLLPPEDGRLVLEYLDDDVRSDLCFSAAEVLTDYREKDPRRLVELRIHFAVLNAGSRAGDPDIAYEMLRPIDTVLRRWNRADLLLPQRLEFRRSLTDEHLRMINENAIGGIYVSRGDYGLAAEAYRNALGYGDQPEDDVRSVKVLTNRAQMHVQTGRTDDALHDYQFILDETDRQVRPQIWMAALEGMADCYRRRGRYEWATQCAKDALAGFTEHWPGTGDAPDFALTRAVTLNLKLARWHGELKLMDEAERFVAAASTLVSGDSGVWLRPAVLDGWADVFLHRGERRMAETAAEEAVAQAIALHDPVILLQARTTLCLVYLKNEWPAHAAAEIGGAFRYRRRLRSLIVLALMALTSRQRGEHVVAHRYFEQLKTESATRVENDPEDFGAWDYHGVAWCGTYLRTGEGLSEAVAAIERARRMTQPTPILEDTLRDVLRRLDETADRPASLRPAIEAIDHPDRRLP